MRKALLLIWADIDPELDDDFNRWYAREHLAERMAIPGFEIARRFVALQGSPRYLALYRTASLDVFRSAAYRNAFANQTEWSRRMFDRMRNTIRRVGEIAESSGDGEGAFLALFVLPGDARRPDRAALDDALGLDGVVSAWVLVADAELSVPLTAAAAATTPTPIVIVEGTAPEAAEAAARRLTAYCGSADAPVARFAHLCSLARRDG